MKFQDFCQDKISGLHSGNDGAPGVIRTPGTRFRKVTLCPLDLFRILLFLCFYCELGPDIRIAFPAISLRFGVANKQKLYSAFNEKMKLQHAEEL